MPAISQAKFMNKIDNNFHFEKYKTAESAKDALLKLHPIGGNAGELIKDLDIAIKNKKIFDPIVDNVKDRISDKGSYIYFSYKIKRMFYFYTEWRAIVYVDPKDNNKITDIWVNKFFHTL